MKSRLIAPAMALVGLSPAVSQAQHVHGVIELGVVVEGNTVAVSLHAPMSDVVGFEHEPNGEEQTAIIQDAAARLGDAGAMFGFPEAAGCEVSEWTVDGPPFVMQHLGDGGDDHDHEHDHDNDHDHDHDHGSDSHDDHHAHDHEHDHGHDHGDQEQHSEINATYEWSCDDSSKIDMLELRFTSDFANVETIELQVLTASGAKVDKLEGRVASIPLSAP